ncbi:MAG: hypothetical protein N4A61_07425 [Pelagimonas sp.]|nr:hypothetical protein [Pelagimonas sp.]
MGVVSLLPFAAILGLPIAYGCCWLIGRPILGILLRSPVSWSKAAGWGGAIAGIIAATSIAVGRYRGWRQWQDQTYHSQVGGGDYIRSIDGILTPYGWMVLGQNTLMFIALGMGVALIVRWRIGPGQSESA